MKAILSTLLVSLLAVTALNAKVEYNSLLESAANNHKDSFKFHIKKHKEEINEKDRFGKTAVFYAACFGNIDFLESLIDNKANLQELDNNSQTILHNAIVCNPKNLAKVVNVITNQRRVNLNQQDKDGRTVVMLAAKLKNSDVLKMVTAGGNAHLADNEDKTALMAAAAYNREDAVKFLLKQGVKIDAKNKLGQSAYYFAAQYDHKNIMKLLKKAGATEVPVEVFANAKLLLGAETNDLKMVKNALKDGAEIDFVYTNSTTTALMEAAISGSTEVTRELLKQKADINKQDKLGKTALMYAIEFGRVDIANLLINARADAKISDQNGKSAKDYAISYYQLNLLGRL